MDIAVPSRFACLKIEDDDFRPNSSQTRKKPDNKATKKPNSAAKEASKTSWTATRKKGGSNEKPKSATGKKQNKKQKEEDKDWEEWQKKDAKLVNEEFEQQMQSAILQSKLDFEHQKKFGVIKTEPDTNQGKKKKGKTMSLDQFLETNNKDDEVREEASPREDDKNFFEEVLQTAKKEIIKEKVEQNRKKRQETFEEVISLAHCQEKLEAERAKNFVLEKELEEARKEIALVKKRNTTLCSMLSQGEMKDKAEVLLELERLTNVKEELTDEVTKLHKLLEQERSNKNSGHSSTNDVHAKHSKEKIIKKKKH